MTHLASAWRDYRLFFSEFVASFHTTGSIAPSSRWLAAELARYVPGSQPGGRRILEVGPGTGAVTQQILPRLGPEDRLDLVEMNGPFVDHLRRRLASEPTWQAAAARVRILHQPIQDLRDERPYNAIVSGLPFNNFSGALVAQILDHLARLLSAGGTLSFFEYVGVRPAKLLVSRRAERERLRSVAGALAPWFARAEFHRSCVVRNLPPAWVHHLRPPAS